MNLIEKTTITPDKKSARSVARTRLMALIENGTFNDTGMLPSEAKLAELCGVSRTPLRVVIEDLVSTGIITKTGKRGCVLNKTSSNIHSPMAHTVVFVADFVQSEVAKQRNTPGNIKNGLQQAVLSAGFNLYTIQNIKTLAVKDSVNWLIAQRPKAVVMSAYISSKEENLNAFRALQQAGIPVLLAGDAPHMAEFDRVFSDHEAGAYRLTRHLAELGHCHIVPLDFGHGDAYWMAARQRGYTRAMADLGLAACDGLPQQHPADGTNASNHDTEDFVNWLAGILAPHVLNPDNPIDALLATHDTLCEPLGRALDRLCGGGAQRPAVVGFDGFWDEVETEELRRYRPLASVRARPHVQGEEMIRLLERRLAGELLEPTCVYTEPELVIYDPVT